MIDVRVLKTNFATLIYDLLQLPVMWKNQNAPTIQGDSITLNISNMETIGATDYESLPDENEKATMQGDREIILTVDIISESSFELCIDLINKFRLNSAVDALTIRKMAYVRIEAEPSDISNTINNSFENRAYCELRFRISKVYFNENSIDVPVINTIEGVGELYGGGLKTEPYIVNF